MKKRRKIILIIVLCLLFVSACVEALSRLYLPNIIRPTVKREIANATGCSAELDEAYFSIFRGLVIKGLTLHDHEGIKILTTKKLRIIPKLLPLLLLRFEVRAADIIAPVLTIARDKAGTWNIAEVVSYIGKRGGEGGAPPAKVELLDGRLLVQYAAGAPATDAAEKINMSLKFTPEGTASYKGNILIHADEKSGLTISGTYDSAAGKNTVKVVGESIRVQPYVGLIREVSKIPLKDHPGILDFNLDMEVIGGQEITGSGTATWKDIRISDKSLSLDGTLSMEGNFYTNMKSRPLYRGSMNVSSATLDLEVLPHEFNDVNGLIVFSDNIMSTTNLTAQYRGYDVTALGNLSDFTSPTLDLKVNSTVGIIEILELFGIRDDLSKTDKLSGTAETEIFIEGDLAGKEKFEIMGNIKLKDGAIKAPGMPEAKEITGSVYFIRDLLIIKKMTGTVGDRSISVQGNVNFTDVTQLDLTILSIDTLVSLQGTIDHNKLNLESISGNIGTSTFFITGTVDELDNPTLNLSYRGKINLTQALKRVPQLGAKRFLGMDLIPKGGLRIEGSLKGQPSSLENMTVTVEGSSDSIQLGTWFINNAAFSANLKDKIITVKDFAGVVNQGKIEANGTIDMTHDKRKISLACSASSVNFTQKLDGNTKEEIYGTLSGDMHLEGFPVDPSSLSGEGLISISRGKIWELRFFQGLQSILAVVYPNIGNIVFDQISGTFTLQDGYIESNDLILDSPSVKLYPKGRLSLDGTLDCTMDVDIFDTKGNLIKKLTGTIMNIPGQFMGVKLTGNVQNPQWRPVMLPFLEGIKKTGKRGSKLLHIPLPKKKNKSGSP